MTRDSGDALSRRDVGRATLVGAASLALEATDAAAQVRAQPTPKKRYAIVGVGHRSYLYQEAIQATFPDHAELVACADTNAGRMKLAVEFAKKHGRAEPKTYAATDFDTMLRENKPDAVIVTSVDATHDDYIRRAMTLGTDVITEKPMTTDPQKCQSIIDTRRATGRKCTVCFNYRYTPVRSQLKELLMSGVIGDVLSVDFNWMLDTYHGADYFRRWHSHKKNSGGLMVHKATHHFDLVNWWLSAIPVSVRAFGKRDFYTPRMAKRMGLQSHHERCHTCPEKQKCSFELDLSKDAHLKSLYLDNESYDGYFRDRCVFRPDIDIEDTMNVVVAYDSGATLSYSLNAFAAWEGYVVRFNGTKGRIEHKLEERMALDASVPHAVKAEGATLRVFPLRKAAYEVEVRAGTGDHNGADPLMIADIFGPKHAPDPLLRAADERSGAYSMLVGAAANLSMAGDKPIRIADLVKGLDYPTYPKMPSRTAPIGMPPKV
ncbi:MAG TPA: Gfo/Idh/MocA family oxidoreductase [Polyangiaceae bacterium]